MRKLVMTLAAALTATMTLADTLYCTDGVTPFAELTETESGYTLAFNEAAVGQYLFVGWGKALPENPDDPLAWGSNIALLGQVMSTTEPIACPHVEGWGSSVMVIKFLLLRTKHLYTELEGINGGQSATFTTPYTATDQTRLVTDLTTPNNNNNNMVYLMRGSSAEGMIGFFLDNTKHFVVRHPYSASAGHIWSTQTFVAGNRYTVDASRSVVNLYRHGETTPAVTQEFTNPAVATAGGSNLILFTDQANGNKGAQTLHSLKVYEGDKLVRDFVPVAVGGKNTLYEQCQGNPLTPSGTFSAVGGTTTAAERVTRSAQPVEWKEETFTATFQDWDGSQIGEVQEVVSGAAAVAPDDPVREGYGFIGWEPADFTVVKDTVFTAQYVEVGAGETFETLTRGGEKIASVHKTSEGFTIYPWAGAQGLTAFAAFGAEVPAEGADMPASWTCVKPLGEVTAKTVVPLPEGWGSEVRAMRLFFVDGKSPYPTIGGLVGSGTSGSAGAYLDTPYYPNAKTTVAADITLPGGKKNFAQMIFRAFAFQTYITANALTVNQAYHNTNPSISTSRTGLTAGSRHIFATTPSAFLMDNGSVVNFSASGPETKDANLRIFASQDGTDLTTPLNFGAFTLHELAVAEDDEILHDYVPVEANGAYTLYDRVTGDLLEVKTYGGAAVFGKAGDTAAVSVAGVSAILEPEHLHDWGEWTLKTPPTCTEAGESNRVCQAAGCPVGEETAVAPALGHVWGEWVTDVEPTRTAEGHKYRECQRDGCDAKEEETLPMTRPELFVWTGRGENANWTNPANWEEPILPRGTEPVAFTSAANVVAVDAAVESPAAGVFGLGLDATVTVTNETPDAARTLAVGTVYAYGKGVMDASGANLTMTFSSLSGAGVNQGGLNGFTLRASNGATVSSTTTFDLANTIFFEAIGGTLSLPSMTFNNVYYAPTFTARNGSITVKAFGDKSADGLAVDLENAQLVASGNLFFDHEASGNLGNSHQASIALRGANPSVRSTGGNVLMGVYGERTEDFTLTLVPEPGWANRTAALIAAAGHAGLYSGKVVVDVTAFREVKGTFRIPLLSARNASELELGSVDIEKVGGTATYRRSHCDVTLEKVDNRIDLVIQSDGRVGLVVILR